MYQLYYALLYFPFLVGCPDLTAPTNGMITCSLGDDGFATDGDTCGYTCNTGYVLSGDDMRTCGSDRSWTGSDPVCLGKGNY